MAALCAGSYGLSQQQQHPSNDKELIFVKLTDSALRAIEECLRQSKLGSAQNPSIQFLSNGQGNLFFFSNCNNVQKFSFSIADIEGGGSLECIQQSQAQQLQNMGHISHKMRIHANDDVYETTKHRMAAVDKNQKNKCTREIKPGQTDIGRKVKLKNPTNRISNIPSSNSVLSKRDSLHSSSNNYSSSNNNNHISSNNNSNHINNHNSSSNNNNNNHNSSSVNSSSLLSSSVPSGNTNHNHSNSNNNNNNHHHSQLHSVSNNYNNSLSTSPKLPKSNGMQYNNSHSNNQSSITAQQQQSKPGYQHTVQDPPQQQQQQQQKSENGVISNRVANGRKSGNSDITKRSIRERLIHLLAIRPWKKPELINRIQQEGIRGQEKNCIGQVLKTISSIRDNVYYLHRHIWNDVQEDWPFYTEQERQLLKRRKPQNLTPPLSSDGGSSTSGQSPSSVHNDSSPSAGSKRPSVVSNDDPSIGSIPTSKKPRISHYKKEILPDANRSNVTPNAQESEDSGVSLSYSLVSNDVARRIQNSSSQNGVGVDSSTTKVVVVDNVINEQDNYDDQITAYREDSKKFKNVKDDFSDQFTTITSVEQRRKYKTEFDNDFQEYRRLHQIVQQVSKKFAQLEEDMRHEQHNERRYKEIQRQIIKAYDENIKDTRFQETKERFNYLHSKLSHIKHLVNDYDVAIRNEISRPQSPAY